MSSKYCAWLEKQVKPKDCVKCQFQGTLANCLQQFRREINEGLNK